MHILVTGINQSTASLKVREGISFSKEQLPAALTLLRERVGEAVILETCNRTEIYTSAENVSKATDQVRSFIAEFHELGLESVSPHLYEYIDTQAVRHLFRVASGLDSMIIGESEILGQVRDALTPASEVKSVDTPLVGLFHAAIRTGRKVREETELGRNSLSISYAGVKLAQKVLGTLRGRSVLLIGAGEAGTLVAKALRTVGVSDLIVANRTRARTEELVQNLGGRAIPFDEIAATLQDVDIVITATNSPQFIIDREMVSWALAGRFDRPLFFFDLAMPRDVDPQVAAFDEVELFNIDDLSAIAEENHRERRRAAVKAEGVVDDEVSKFMAWWESLDVVPLIRDLRQQAEEARKGELARALRQMPDLPAEYLKVVEALTQSIVNKLLHHPTASLKRQAGGSQLEAIRDIYQLKHE
ncbi:MAG: glutamyl-tRNA reductase [Chloroflexi bacterium]|nr:glutamyl-tRNA reductase [Chloroflexota bacterium]